MSELKYIRRIRNNLLESAGEWQTFLCCWVAWRCRGLTVAKYLKTICKINCLPWKVGKYKSCYHNCYASIKVDEEADVTLHLLQVSIVHAFHHGTKQEGDSHLGEKEIIFNLYSSHPKCIEHLSYWCGPRPFLESSLVIILKNDIHGEGTRLRISVLELPLQSGHRWHLLWHLGGSQH